MQLAARHELFVGDIVGIDRLAVERHGTDIAVAARRIGRDGECPPVGQAHGGPLEERRRQDKLVRAGADGIEAQRREDIPGRHLPAVLVADDALGRRGIHLVEQAARQLLRLPRHADITIEVGHVVARLIAVCILAHEARDVVQADILVRGFEREEAVELPDEGLAAAEELLEAVHVVRSEEAVLPRRGLGVVASGDELLEGRRPAAVALPPAEEAGRAVEDIDIVERPAVILRGNVAAAQRLGHAGDRPVVIGVFEDTGDRLAEDIRGDVSVGDVILRPLAVAVRRAHHGVERVRRIEAPDSLHPGVGDNRRGMVADHRARLARREGPDRQLARHIVHVEHRADHVAHKRRVDKRLQGVPRPEGIPQREGRIVGPAGGQAADGAVAAAVVAVDVAHQVGREFRMILRRIEDRALVARAALDDNVRQGVAPQRLGACAHGIEIEFGNLREAVLTGILRADGRETHGHGERPDLRSEGEDGLPVAEQLDIGEGLREACREVDVLVGHPALRAAHALDLVGGRLPQFAQVDPLVGERVHQVDDHAPRPLAAEHVAVHARAGRRRQLDLQPVVGELDGVVAARGLLATVREGVGRVAEFAVAHHVVAQRGIEEDISQIGAPRAAQMRMREAVDRRIVVVVAGAGVPVARARVGAELHHAEGGRGAGIGVAVESGSDEGIDVIDRIRGLHAGCTCACRQGQSQGSHHGCSGSGSGFGYTNIRKKRLPTMAICAFASSICAQITPSGTSRKRKKGDMTVSF